MCAGLFCTGRVGRDRAMVRGVFRFIDTSLDRVFSILGAAAFSQVPEFIQQYLQRLGGHLDEAKRQVEIIANVLLLRNVEIIFLS